MWIILEGAMDWNDQLRWFFQPKSLLNTNFQSQWYSKEASVHFGERCSFWRALFILGSAVHFGEHCSWTKASLLYHWLPNTNSAPQNERCSPIWTFEKKTLKMAVFATEMLTKLAKRNLWLDRCIQKVFLAKKSAWLVIPVRSTFHGDSHPPIGGHHRN